MTAKLNRARKEEINRHTKKQANERYSKHFRSARKALAYTYQRSYQNGQLGV